MIRVEFHCKSCIHGLFPDSSAKNTFTDHSSSHTTK
uniref:Uncharacterized protein n=1 Tax=Anguilla anguilla TaxID=7936 RepID=A0A0E9RFW6_ANGAN